LRTIAHVGHSSGPESHGTARTSMTSVTTNMNATSAVPKQGGQEFAGSESFLHHTRKLRRMIRHGAAGALGHDAGSCAGRVGAPAARRAVDQSARARACRGTRAGARRAGGRGRGQHRPRSGALAPSATARPIRPVCPAPPAPAAPGAVRQQFCANTSLGDPVPVGRTLLHRLQTLRGPSAGPAGQTGALQCSEVQFRTGITGSSTITAMLLQILAVKLALPSGLPRLRGRSARGPAGWGMRAAP